MKKPKGCIYPDCLNCPLADCRYDGVEPGDIEESDNRDLEARMFKNPKYLKLIASREKYEKSEKGKQRQKRYERTEKARQRQKSYYKRHREEILEKRRLQRIGRAEI